MHQLRRSDRWFADILMAMVLYPHFRSEHLLVHHRYVGTPRDAVTGRYNENVHRFFIRVSKTSYRSPFRAEAQRLTRQGREWYDLKNRFGFTGSYSCSCWPLSFFFHLQLINYLEHYGLTQNIWETADMKRFNRTILGMQSIVQPISF